MDWSNGRDNWPTWARKCHLRDRQGKRLVDWHILLREGVENPLIQCDRLSRLRFQLWQNTCLGRGLLVEGPVFQLGQVLEEAQARYHNAFVVLHLDAQQYEQIDPVNLRLQVLQGH